MLEKITYYTMFFMLCYTIVLSYKFFATVNLNKKEKIERVIYCNYLFEKCIEYGGLEKKEVYFYNNNCWLLKYFNNEHEIEKYYKNLKISYIVLVVDVTCYLFIKLIESRL